MLSQQMHCFDNSDVCVIVCDGIPYFKAIDVTTALGYVDAAQAIRKNVQKKYVKSWSELCENACSGVSVDLSSRHGSLPSSLSSRQGSTQAYYVNESGLYELFWHSRKPQALRFREWVVEEVLPSIRKTGKYIRGEQVSLMNEADLHYKVIEFIRRFWMDAVVVAGLGELQDTSTKRLTSWRKGYTAGQPDILLLNRTRRSCGLAIELKTPLGCGVISAKQTDFLNRLESNKYDTFISNDYDEIVVRILEYREEARRCDKRVRVRSSVE